MPAGKGQAIPQGMVDVTKPGAPVATPKPTEAPATVEAVASEAPAVETPAAPAESGVELSKTERAKQAADKARKGAQQNRKLLEERERLARDAQHAQNQLAQQQQQLTQTNDFLRALQADPLGALKQMGVTPEQVAQRMAQEGSPEAMIAAVRAELEATKKEIETLRSKEREALESSRRQAIENEYKQAAQNEKKYPNLSKIHPDFVVARTKELISELARRGEDPARFSNHDYLSYLESAYAQTKAAADTTPPAAEATSGTEKKTATITNRIQSASHSAPPDFNKMSDRQQKKWMADQIRAQYATK